MLCGRGSLTILFINCDGTLALLLFLLLFSDEGSMVKSTSDTLI